MKTDDLLSMAESLPLDIKTQLIDKLLNSLNPSQRDIDDLWAKEAEKRLAEIKRGEVEAIPGEAVFDEIHQRFSE